MDLKNKAKEMFLSGTSLIDISKELNKPAGTIRRWKSEDNWEGEKVSERSPKTKERSVKRSVEKKEVSNSIDKSKIVAKNLNKVTKGLTEQQKLFVSFYANSSNARQSALNAGYSPVYARTNVYTELLSNVSIKEAIAKLRAEIHQEIIINGIEVVNKHIAIANSDITDYFDEEGKPKPLSEIDGRLIKKIKAAKINTELFTADGLPKKIETKEIIEFEVEDRQRSLDFLSKYTGLEKKNTSENEEEETVQIEVEYVQS